MSGPVAERVLSALASQNLLSTRLRVVDDAIEVGSGSALLPSDGPKASWRRTVNRSLLPRSVSSEHRRQLLYAVLQDLTKAELALREDGTEADPLGSMDQRLAPFARVHRVPVGKAGSGGRRIVFPLHVAVPLAFDTYKRQPVLEGPDVAASGLRHQTDKGFRGAFIHFFSRRGYISSGRLFSPG